MAKTDSIHSEAGKGETAVVAEVKYFKFENGSINISRCTNGIDVSIRQGIDEVGLTINFKSTNDWAQSDALVRELDELVFEAKAEVTA